MATTVHPKTAETSLSREMKLYEINLVIIVIYK